MDDKLKILLCEDDENLGMLLREYLQAKGYQATLCPDGEAGYKEFLRTKYDICVFDVMMPKKDGFSLAKDVRQANAEMPIIFLTAKTLKDDILEGFKIGADDYITKPIRPKVLISRIQSLLKRAKPKEMEPEVLVYNEIILNRDKFQVTMNNVPINMPNKEFKLLELLISKPEHVFTREEIFSLVWGTEIVVGDRTIDVHIRKLREKLGEKYIYTIKGIGYTFARR